ncbi:DUF2442 domain-containing protein [Clostridium beijerinckii]|jgi:hypothetical protein|uniref:DUF2442 domain-containing protein n=2 Tax=Clostridium beijerinckii TaxID=1520 RepID=A0AB74VJ72_CLOBE|nr:DUF2442 domain-containing protein [Clostridium beijerinckii]MBC2460535.1 DUF2442 domain-containing protein [Clostridium beijerinckii]MBC2478045.1 DUF2442 domain-containing protein [Clostridium beijerinckii]MCI1479251.1 DUF2442 domain-containing protein [Clostridium beijerinckii]MDG5857091.1 DUF2442 domain-containing protein [Clostridium beijerinckii]MZL11740.1 DUF2442 domain-containing protein [Clostridium beijerinckii]
MEYMPEVIQVRPTNDFKVYVYFDDGSIKLYDAKELINKGIFTKVKDINVFKETCTVLNGTLAWDLDGNYNENTCLDIDPFEIYENCPDVDE